MKLLSPCTVPVTVTHCHNLTDRVADDPSQLGVVFAPPLCLTNFGRLLCLVTTSDFEWHYVTCDPSGRKLSLVDMGDRRSYTFEQVIQTPGRLLREFQVQISGVVKHHDSFTVYCADGSSHVWYYNPDDPLNPWVDADSIPELPGFSLEAVDKPFIEATIPAHVLHDSYSRTSHRLSDIDFASVADSLRRAYTSLAEDARAAGVFFQPVIAAYRLLDKEGCEIYRSAPVLLQHSQGSQLAQPVAFTIDGGDTLSGATLSAGTFTIDLVASTALHPVLKHFVASAEILVSSQIHPYNPSAIMRHTMNASAGGPITVRMSLPGASNALSSATAAIAGPTLCRALANIGTIAECAHIINSRHLGSLDAGQHVSVDSGAIQPLATEISSLLKLRYPKGAPSSVVYAARASLAGTLGCTDLCRSADIVAYANPLITTFRGFNPLDYVVGRSPSGSWQAYVAVTMSDNSVKVVRQCSGSSSVPEALSPVITFPSADAVELSFVACSGGVVRRVDLPLTPLIGVDMAVYVSREFKPVTLLAVDEDFEVPDNNPHTLSLAGYVAVAQANNPSHILCMKKVADTPVVAIHAATDTAGAWNFNRRHIYAFGDFGIRLLTVDASLSTISVGTVSTDPVVSPSLIVPDTDGSFIVASGSPLAIHRLSGNRLKKIAADVHLPDNLHRIALDTLRNELWCVPRSPSSGTSTLKALVMCLGTTGGKSTPCFTADVAASLPPGITPSMVAPPEIVEVEWAATFSPQKCRVLPTVELQAVAGRIDGSLTIAASHTHADNAGDHTCNIAQIMLDGTLLSPVHVPLPPIATSAPLRISLKARVTPDFRLKNIVIHNKQPLN